MYINRGPNKVHPDYGLRDIYKYYKDNAKNPLKYKRFRYIWLKIAKIIIRLIVYRNLDFAIPARLGTLCIRKSKIEPVVLDDGTVIKDRLGVDYKASWKKWVRQYPDLNARQIAKIKHKKPVYHLNEHTNGYRVRWRWDKFTATVKNQSIYSLAMTRENKQELSNAFKNFKADYYCYDRR
jgi:hypothetical protein